MSSSNSEPQRLIPPSKQEGFMIPGSPSSLRSSRKLSWLDRFARIGAAVFAMVWGVASLFFIYGLGSRSDKELPIALLGILMVGVLTVISIVVMPIAIVSALGFLRSPDPVRQETGIYVLLWQIPAGIGVGIFLLSIL